VEESVSVTSFADLPLAGSAKRWNGGAAEKRVRRWAGAQEKPNAAYRRAHLWYDSSKKELFTGYKLLFADIIDGELVAVPRALAAAAAVLDGARGGLDVPDRDRSRLRSHLARYYKKMGESPPWES
jgi:hypothetical protein